jgi:hypothetical protein
VEDQSGADQIGEGDTGWGEGRGLESNALSPGEECLENFGPCL